MYFFLFGLSCFEICYTFVIVPKFWPRAFHKSDYLFLWVCFPALFLCGLGLNQLFPNCCDELWLLYCHLQPFQLYTHCQLRHLHAVGLASGFCGFLISVVANVLVFSVHFSASNWINHFFCDISPVINLGCTDTNQKEMVIFFLNILVLLVPLVLIFISYVFIVSTILKISSVEGQHKAFATCVSHITAVIFHYGLASFMYLRPTSLFSSYKDQLVAVTYTVITPLFNPLVCTLRNKEVKTALRKVLSRYLFPKTIWVSQYVREVIFRKVS